MSGKGESLGGVARGVLGTLNPLADNPFAPNLRSFFGFETNAVAFQSTGAELARQVAELTTAQLEDPLFQQRLARVSEEVSGYYDPEYRKSITDCFGADTWWRLTSAAIARALQEQEEPEKPSEPTDSK